MRVLASALLLLSLSAARAGAQDLPALWNELFEADDQRILYAITADPAADRELREGMARVLAARDDPRAYAYEKARFHLEWLGRIESFSRRYGPRDEALMARGRSLAKPSAAEIRRRVAWFAKEDGEHWEDQLIPRLVESMDAYELGYGISVFRSLSPEQRRDTLRQLTVARYTPFVGVDKVVSALIEKTRKGMAEDLAAVRKKAPSLAASVREQLDQLALKLAAAPAQTLEQAAEAGRQFDGSEQLEAKAPPVRGGEAARKETPGVPPVGESGPVKPDQGTLLASKKAYGALDPKPEKKPEKQPEKKPALGRSSGGQGGGLAFDEMPAPKAPDQKLFSKATGGGVMGMLKGPLKGAGIGALIGGLIGFLFGGPIGAALGALGGALIGGGAVTFLKNL